MSLPSTQHYEIVITVDPEHLDTSCYGVRNLETQVVEYYDNLLPRTFQAMMHTQEQYDAMLQQMASGGRILTVVPEDADIETVN